MVILVALLGGGFIGWMIQYFIAKAKGRGQLIRDAMRYSWRLVEKVRPEGAKQDVGFVRVYDDGDKERFIGIFKEVVGVFLREYPMWPGWHLRKK